MARPQKYKPDQVLEAVTELFKIQGYRATSIDQMLAVTQLSRSSLYNGFGNKEALYLMVLEKITLQMTHLHMNMAKENQLKPLEPANFLRLFFQSYYTDTSLHPTGVGCLLVNTVVELGDTEPALVGRALGYLKLAEQALAAYFITSQKTAHLVHTKILQHWRYFL
jgi:TetR/AcrR family transcriptional repressor of nem operon